MSEKHLWLVEKKPDSCIVAGELVDEFAQTRAEGELPLDIKKPVQC